MLIILVQLYHLMLLITLIVTMDRIPGGAGEAPICMTSSKPHSSSVRFFRAVCCQGGRWASRSLSFLISNREMRIYFIGSFCELSEIMQLMVFSTHSGTSEVREAEV